MAPPFQIHKCLFCSETDLTREHVWPDWICKDPLLRMNYATLHRDRIANTAYRTIKNSLTRKCLCVCKGCNGGRMKDIEDATKPILQPMIHGNHPSSLSRDTQKAL